MARACAALLATILGATSVARAEDPRPPPPPSPAAGSTPAKPTDPKKPEPPKLVPDAEAPPLVEGLKKAWKAKTAVDAAPAFDAIAGKTHPTFEAPLVKLLSHGVSDVAKRAANALADRAGPKTASSMWRSGWLSPVNKDRPEVRATILEGLGRMGAPLDAKQYDEVESLWRRTDKATVMTAIATYFRDMKTDKRPLRLLSEMLDEPMASNPNDASNPPASYWEARWKLWKAALPAIQDAIKAITGQSFETTAQAKAWFRANPKFGFDW